MTDNVSTQQKETEPYISPSETKPVVDDELEKAGVVAQQETPNLTKEHVEIGVKHSMESNPPSTEATGKVVLPFTENEAEELIKENKDKSLSIVWLASQVVRQFKRIHRKLFNK